jgi:hypothetical protein
MPRPFRIKTPGKRYGLRADGIDPRKRHAGTEAAGVFPGAALGLDMLSGISQFRFKA